jgi:hypothetical protein
MNQPFVGFYSAPLRSFLALVDDKTLRAFIGLAAHTDARGICFPGVRQLAAVCALPIASVFEALANLEALGIMIYVRRDKHDPDTRRQLPNVYALHPELLLVSESLDTPGFITISNITKKPDLYYPSSRIVSRSEEESRSRIKKQNQVTSHQDNTSSNQPVGPQSLFTSGASEKTGQEPDKNQATRSESKARSAGGRDSSRAAPGEPRDLQPYKLPLEHGDAETLAQRLISAAADMSLSNARMLVDVYGLARVRDSLMDFERDYSPRIKSPARYLRVLIRKNLFNADGEEWSDE